jgi:hypothetical protein
MVMGYLEDLGIVADDLAESKAKTSYLADLGISPDEIQPAQEKSLLKQRRETGPYPEVIDYLKGVGSALSGVFSDPREQAKYIAAAFSEPPKGVDLRVPIDYLAGLTEQVFGMGQGSIGFGAGVTEAAKEITAGRNKMKTQLPADARLWGQVVDETGQRVVPLIIPPYGAAVPGKVEFEPVPSDVVEKKARAGMERVAEAFSYHPVTPGGQKGLENIGELIESVVRKPSSAVGQFVSKLTGDKAWGYGAELATELAMFKLFHSVGSDLLRGKAKKLSEGGGKLDDKVFKQKSEELLNQARKEGFDLNTEAGLNNLINAAFPGKKNAEVRAKYLDELGKLRENITKVEKDKKGNITPKERDKLLREFNQKVMDIEKKRISPDDTVSEGARARQERINKEKSDAESVSEPLEDRIARARQEAQNKIDLEKKREKREAEEAQSEQQRNRTARAQEERQRVIEEADIEEPTPAPERPAKGGPLETAESKRPAETKRTNIESREHSERSRFTKDKLEKAAKSARGYQKLREDLVDTLARLRRERRAASQPRPEGKLSDVKQKGSDKTVAFLEKKLEQLDEFYKKRGGTPPVMEYSTTNKKTTVPEPKPVEPASKPAPLKTPPKRQGAETPQGPQALREFGVKPVKREVKSVPKQNKVEKPTPVGKKTEVKEKPQTKDERFHALADQQRGKPESAMLKVQNKLGGGVLSPVVEHAGDLIHRMSQHPDFYKGGFEWVKEKVDKVHRYLHSEFGFEKEHKQNWQNNAKYRKKDPTAFKKDLDAALKIYAKEHGKLKPFNDVQKLANDLAIAIGEQRWNEARRLSSELKKITDKGRENWEKVATKEGFDEKPTSVPKKDAVDQALDTLEKETPVVPVVKKRKGGRGYEKQTKAEATRKEPVDVDRLPDGVEADYEMRYKDRKLGEKKMEDLKSPSDIVAKQLMETGELQGNQHVTTNQLASALNKKVKEVTDKGRKAAEAEDAKLAGLQRVDPETGRKPGVEPPKKASSGVTVPEALSKVEEALSKIAEKVETEFATKEAQRKHRVERRVARKTKQLLKKLDKEGRQGERITQERALELLEREQAVKAAAKQNRLAKHKAEIMKRRKAVKGGTKLYSGIPVDEIPKVVRAFFRKYPSQRGDVFRNRKLWEETGYWIGRDGFWRKEDFSEVKFNVNRLESAYRRAEEIPLSLAVVKRGGGKLPREYRNIKLFLSERGGFYNPNGKYININWKEFVEDFSNQLGVDKNTAVYADFHQAFWHEIQHALQDRVLPESFKGANFDLEIRKHLNKFAETIRPKIRTVQGLELLDAIVNMAKRSGDVRTFMKNNAWALADHIKGDLTESRRMEIVSDLWNTFYRRGKRDYLLNRGEMEARLFAERAALTKKMRKEYPPWEHLDDMLEFENLNKAAGTTLYGGIPIDEFKKFFKRIFPKADRETAINFPSGYRLTKAQAERVANLTESGISLSTVKQLLVDSGLSAKDASNALRIFQKESPLKGKKAGDTPLPKRKDKKQTWKAKHEDHGKVLDQRKKNKDNYAPPIYENIAKSLVNLAENIGDLPKWISSLKTGTRIIEKMGKPVVDSFYHTMNEAKEGQVRQVKADQTRLKEIRKIKGLTAGSPKRIGVAMIHDRSPRGRATLEKMGIKVRELTDPEIRARGLLEKFFKEKFEEVNQARIDVGLEPFTGVTDYVTFIHDLSVLDRFDIPWRFKSTKKIRKLMDDIHPSETGFRFGKKASSELTLPLETNVFKLADIYGRAAVRHSKLTPTIGLLQEHLRGFKHPETGKWWRLEDKAPNAYKYLRDWLDYEAGVRPTGGYDFPKLEKFAMRASKNLVAAFLAGSIRTVVIQPTAALFAAAQTHPKYSMAAAKFFASKATRKFVERNSNLITREYDIVQQALADAVLSKNPAELHAWATKKTLSGVKYADMATSGYVWYMKYLEGRGLGLNRKAASRRANLETVKSQGSAASHDLPKVQKVSLGRAVTLFQTFNINQLGAMVNDIMGFNRPVDARIPVKRRLAQTVAALTMIEAVNVAFEEGADMESPLPAPFLSLYKSLAGGKSIPGSFGSVFKEVAEYIPVIGGAVKFGGSFGGPIADTIEKLLDLQRRTEGREMSDKEVDYMVELLFYLGGAPGSRQFYRYKKSREKGYGVVQSLLGPKYKPGEKAGRNTRRARGSGRKRWSRKRD